VATAFLVLAVIGLLGTLNAWFPTRARLLLIPSFFWSWLTIELAPWVLFWHVAGTAFFVWRGALDSTAGQVALALTVLSAVGLVVTIVLNTRTVVTVGGVIADLDVDGTAPRFPRTQVWLPFLMRHRDGVAVTRNVTFAEVDGTALRLDVYAPANATPGARLPGILQIHGGAWVLGDKREQAIPLLNHLAANGWVGVNANYRLSPLNPKRDGPAFPAHLQDVKRAIAWYRAHAEEYGADPDFLCVTGGSAGGHLTALVGLTAGDPEYQPGFEDVDTTVNAAVPFYGIYDFTNRAGNWKNVLARFIGPVVMRRRFEDDPEAFHRASPLDRVRPDAPPFFLIHGNRDTLAPVRDARAFASSLRAVSGAPVLYAEMIGAQHAFDIFPSFRTAAVIEGVERYLTSVHQAYLAGREGAAVHDAEVAAPLVDAN
jgi:acetyl esterase/lipase